MPETTKDPVGEAMAGLTKTLTEALTPKTEPDGDGDGAGTLPADFAETVQKAVTAAMAVVAEPIVKRIDSLEAKFTPAVDADEGKGVEAVAAGELAKALGDVDLIPQILQALVDRVDKLEDHTALSKSYRVGDGDGGDGDGEKPKLSMWDGVVATLASGRKVELT